MGPDCVANRECHDGADAGLSGSCAATASPRWSGFHHRNNLSASASARAVLQAALFTLWQYRGYAAAGSWLSIQQRWDHCRWESTQWKRLREPPKYFAFK